MGKEGFVEVRIGESVVERQEVMEQGRAASPVAEDEQGRVDVDPADLRSERPGFLAQEQRVEPRCRP